MKLNAIPFRSLVDIWKEQWSFFIKDLSEQGFAPLTNECFQKLGSGIFQKTLFPRSSVSESRVGNCDFSSSFTYVGKDCSKKALEKNSERWALVFADLSFEKSELNFFKENPVIFVKNPDAAVDYVLGKISPLAWAAHEKHANEKFEGVLVEPGAVIGPNVQIGKGSIIETGVRLGARVVIGENTRIGAYTRIADDCVVGKFCNIASHTSIGGQGFGFVKYPKVPAPLPRLHVGRAVIGDHVRIGSQVSIDRGVFEDTVIGNYSAFDNHVQIAHNCVVGANNVYCAFVGLSGSTKVGDRVTFGAMAGTKGHLEIGSDVIVAGQSGVTADLPNKSVVKGYPPRPLQEALKIQVLVSKLPEFYNRLKKLEKENA